MSNRGLLFLFAVILLFGNGILFSGLFLVNFDEVFIHTHDDAVTLNIQPSSEKKADNRLESIRPKSTSVRLSRPSVSRPPIVKKTTERANPVQPIGLGTSKDVLPILVIACNRPTVKRCLELLLKYRPSKEKNPIIVSQDCGHQMTADVIKSFGEAIKHMQQPDLSAIVMDRNIRNPTMQGYYKISRHYKWALTQIFDVMKYDSVVIVEDDLDVSPDFYEYFSATKKLLQVDPSLWCVSAWNDNGKSNFIDTNKPERIYRSDFFPGLGWMLLKGLWDEIKEKWPRAFWDDWMRDSAQRKGRACLRPEVSRTQTFGKVGVSKGQFYDKHLQFIVLNEHPVHFNEMDLSLLIKEQYDATFVPRVYHLPAVSIAELLDHSVSSNEVRVEYHSNALFTQLANQFGIMSDLKDGVPRLAYKGIVTFMFKGYHVHLAPPPGWTEYQKRTRR
eukprot:m.13948 g.13948  ORF g.13948 m.13948 type:complete len:445 (+) comp25336_c0_seq3:39-1373(+)